jgi:hypothetical protein
MLSDFKWPELSRWKGLPRNLTLATAREALDIPEGGWRSGGYLGEEPRALEWLNATSPSFPRAVRLWLSGDNVVMIDSDILGRAEDLERLVAKLGRPAATLDSYFSNALMPKSEWVYPDIGLALFVEPENHNPLRIAVYPKTTLSDYRKNFRPIHRPSFKGLPNPNA